MYILVDRCMYIYKYIYIYIDICVQIYVYMYTYMYIYTYIYTHMITLTSDKSASQEFFILVASNACSLHFFASASTITDCSLAMILSAVIFTNNSSVAMYVYIYIYI
jgi:hypothetical protein